MPFEAASTHHGMYAQVTGRMDAEPYGAADTVASLADPIQWMALEGTAQDARGPGDRAVRWPSRRAE